LLCIAAPGTKDAMQRGGRRFSALIQAHNKKPKLPLHGLSGCAVITSDPYGTLEAGAASSDVGHATSLATE